jgi:hypothetical protein
MTWVSVKFHIGAQFVDHYRVFAPEDGSRLARKSPSDREAADRRP